MSYTRLDTKHLESQVALRIGFAFVMAKIGIVHLTSLFDPKLLPSNNTLGHDLSGHKLVR